MSNLFICFFGDGRLWDNIVLTMAYPSGFSYFRPFRYRDKYIQPKLLKNIEDPSKRKEFTEMKATLAMRFFSDEQKWRLLPIRQINITHIDYLPDNHSIYFTLGPIVDFSLYNDIQSICIEIPTEERQSELANNLFFRTEAVVPNNLFNRDDSKEDAIWVAYSDLISRDRNLPIKEEARRSIYL